MARASLIVGRPAASPPADRGRAVAEVARHPHDLERHAARIRTATTAEEAYGALVDLFIATAPMHEKLRRLALEDHGGLLTEAQRATLDAAVPDGLSPTSAIPSCPASLFTAGATCGAPLLVRPDQEATRPAEPARPDAPTGEHRPATRPATTGTTTALAGLAIAALLALVLRRILRGRARR